jgi:hypothetical protein
VIHVGEKPMTSKRIFTVILFFTIALQIFAQEKVDLQIVQRIRQEGLQNSKVMDYMSYLCDVLGPRLA